MSIPYRIENTDLFVKQSLGKDVLHLTNYQATQNVYTQWKWVPVINAKETLNTIGEKAKWPILNLTNP